VGEEGNETAMRFARRAIGIILLFILFSAITLAILARTPFVHRFLRDKVVAFANATYRGTLQIGRVEGSVWTNLRLDQVALLYEGKTIASIPQLSLEYSLLSLPWRTIHLRLTIDSPQITAIRQPTGKWNLLEALSERTPAPPSSAPRTLRIDVDSVQVDHGILQIMPNGDSGPNYRVTNLAMDTGVTLPAYGMAVNLRHLTANVVAPKMPLLYAATSLKYNALGSPATVQLADLDLRTQRSTISMVGDARLARTPTVDLKLWLRRLAAADVAQIYPAAQLKSDVDGTLTVQGPESALRSTIALNCAGATLDAVADADVTRKSPPFSVKLNLSNVDLQKIVITKSAAGILDATINAKGAGSDTAAATADVRLHGRDLVAKQYRLGTLNLTATAANKSAHLMLTLAAPAGYLTARAKGSLSADPTYHLDLAAQHLNIAKTGVTANAQPTNVNFSALIDGHGLTPAAADTGIQLRVGRSQVGQIIVNRGLLDSRIANNRADIAQLYFSAAGTSLDAHGSAGLAPNALSNISYALRSQNIGQLLAIAKMKGSGSLDINGVVSGPRSALLSRGTIRLSSFQTGGFSLEQGTTLYHVALTGPGAPYGDVDVNINRVKAGTELRNLSLLLNASPGVPHAIALQLKVTDNAGRKDFIATHLTYRPPSVAGQLTQMTLGLPTGSWHLLAPVEYKRDPRSVSISRLQLQSGSRELVLQGTIAQQGAQDFSLILNRFDLAALQPLSPRLHEVHGMLSTNLRIAGTAAAPTLSFATQASRLGLGQQPLGDLNTRMNYAGERATFDAVLQQTATDHLTAIGSVPISLSWDHGIKTKIGSALDVTVNSPRLSLAQLGTLFPDDVKNFQGILAIDLRVQGTLKQPQAVGSVRISGVGGEIVPLGVTISNTKMIVGLDPNAVRVKTIEAHSGHGSISGNAEIGLVQYAPSTLGANLNFDQWPAINTQQYAATLGGHLAANGTLSHPRVEGQLEVLNGTIQPDIAFLSATSNLSPDETIEVIKPGERPPQPNAAQFGHPAVPPQPSVFNNLAMTVAVLIHRNTWIRNPDAAAELQGNLDVDKDPGGPVRVVGEVRTVRGWINYYNREFTLKTGVFIFTGGPKIDPALDIDAQYVVTNYTVDIVVGGTASKPTLQLKSQPELAQADVLSLILFGRTTDSLGQSQQASLQQQATKMATGVAARQIGQAVASSMGLQGLTVNSSSSGGPAVGIGRYIGENTYVSASESVGSGSGQRVSVQYFFLPWLSLTTSSAADGSREIDLNLVKQY
jgi:autotransporter translocation and assembly factor TamB